MFLMLPSSTPTSILDMVNSVTQTLQSIYVTLKWAQWKVHSTDRQTPFCLFAVCLHRIFKTHQWKAQSCCFGGCTISLRAAESAKKWRARKSHMFLVPDSSRTAASATTATATLRLYQEKKRERRMKEIPTAVKASKQKCFTDKVFWHTHAPASKAEKCLLSCFHVDPKDVPTFPVHLCHDLYWNYEIQWCWFTEETWASGLP